MAKPAPPSHPTTLFVRNLPPQTTKADLLSHFSGVGPLRRVVHVTDPATSLCRGISFVHYALPEHARAAVDSLNGSLLRHRRIHVEPALSRTRKATDEDGGLLPKHKPEREKKSASWKGSTAMRTVLIRKAGISEQEAKEMVDGLAESIVLAGGVARCRFSSWTEAGKVAAKVHRGEVSACIEALEDGSKTEVIVRNLPFKVKKGEVEKVFAIKPIREFRLAPPKKGKVAGEKEDIAKDGDAEVEECAGFGFVEYFLVADAKHAVQRLNGTKIGGRVVAVDMSVERTGYVKRVEEAERHEDVERHKEAEESEAESDADGSGGEGDVAEGDDEVGDGEAGVGDGEAEVGDGEDDEDSEEEEENASIESTEASPVLKPRMSKPEKKEGKSTPEEMERTVFVRNLLYETSSNELRKALQIEFGPVEQVVLVIDPISKRPRGTAFVRFVTTEEAEMAVARCAAGDTSKTRSVLADESGFVLQGRTLLITKAVDRSRASVLSAKSGKPKKEDKRNMRLAHVGQIFAGMPEAQGCSEEELKRYSKSAKDKKKKLETNPNSFVSDVRLCVRNLPRDLDEKVLKRMFMLAGKGKEKGSTQHREMKKGDSEATKADKKQEENGSQARMPAGHVSHCTIVRDGDRNGRSKGFGFVEFDRHEDAMKALRLVNNNPNVFELLLKEKTNQKMDENRERLLKKQWVNRKLHVEFSIEDRRAVRIIQGVKEKGRKMKEEHRLKKEKEGNGISGGNKKGMKRKRGNGSEEAPKEPEKKKSRAEKKAGMKQKRAQQAEANVRKRNDQEKKSAGQKATTEQQPTNQGVRRHRDQPQSTERVAKKQRRQDADANGVTDAPAPKPKKLRQKRDMKNNIEDDKLDSMVMAYKRKLDKGKSSVTNPKTAAPQQLESSALKRWFE